MSDEKKQRKLIDESNYWDLCKPFESTEALEDAVRGFWEEFYELRNKYRLTDVHVTVRASVKDAGDVMTTLHAGSEMYVEAMTAWALGRAQGDRQEIIAKMVSGRSVKRRSDP